MLQAAVTVELAVKQFVRLSSENFLE